MFEAELIETFEAALAETGIRAASLGCLYPGGRIVVCRGIGNPEGAPLSSAHLFSIGSIAKLWTAQLAVELSDRGQLDLHAPITGTMPEFMLADDDAAAAITAMHLLTHTSGIDGDYLPNPRPTGPADYVRSLAEAPQLHRPGAMFSYCNAGFVILAEAFRRVTGQSWEDGVRCEILSHCGATIALLPEDGGGQPLVTGWRRDDAGAFTVPISGRTGNVAIAAWGDTARATGDDLLRYAEAVLGAGPGIRADLIAQMGRRHGAGPLTGDGWGLGFRRWNIGGNLCLGHDGGVPGETAYLRVIPVRGVAFVLLTAAEDSTPLFETMFGHVCRRLNIGDPEEPRAAPPLAAVDGVAGLYRRYGADIEIRQSAGGLVGERRVLDTIGGLPLRFDLEAAGGPYFRTTPPFGERGRIAFVSDDEGHSFLSTGMRLYPRAVSDEPSPHISRAIEAADAGLPAKAVDL